MNAPRIIPEAVLRLQIAASDPATSAWVAANAGSGKTTLIADFLRKQERPYVWYQLDHTDADPAVFLGYLAYGIQQRVAGFGQLQVVGMVVEGPGRAAAKYVGVER